ncbi:unnamed protein product [Caenorhabditis nigoni]
MCKRALAHRQREIPFLLVSLGEFSSFLLSGRSRAGFGKSRQAGSHSPIDLFLNLTDRIETTTSIGADHLELSIRLVKIANTLLNIQDKKQQVNALQTTCQFELDAEKEKNWMLEEENKALRAQYNQNIKDHRLEVANLHNRLSDAYGFEDWE